MKKITASFMLSAVMAASPLMTAKAGFDLGYSQGSGRWALDAPRDPMFPSQNVSGEPAAVLKLEGSSPKDLAQFIGIASSPEAFYRGFLFKGRRGTGETRFYPTAVLVSQALLNEANRTSVTPEDLAIEIVSKG